MPNVPFIDPNGNFFGLVLTQLQSLIDDRTASNADTNTANSITSGSKTQADGDARWQRKSTLSSVATSGSYSDLANRPASFPPSAHADSHGPSGTDKITIGGPNIASGTFLVGSVTLTGSNHTFTTSLAPLSGVSWTFTPPVNGRVRLTGNVDTQLATTGNHAMKLLQTIGSGSATPLPGEVNVAGSTGRTNMHRSWNNISVTAGTQYTFALAVSGNTSSQAYVNHTSLEYIFFPNATA